MLNVFSPSSWPRALVLSSSLVVAAAIPGATQESRQQQAIVAGQITTVGLVDLYLS